jgi:hypothetical protein
VFLYRAAEQDDRREEQDCTERDREDERQPRVGLELRGYRRDRSFGFRSNRIPDPQGPHPFLPAGQPS